MANKKFNLTLLLS